MVYGGVPSRGCGTCRARKVKCDQTQPSCLNCRKGGRTCTGYRSEHDLVFRDVTNAMKLKARQPSRSRSSSPLLALTPASINLGTQTWLLPTAEDQATSAFFSRFATITPYVGVGAQRFNAGRMSDSLQFAARALAMQSLSKYDNRAHLTRKAASYYSQGLSATQIAIQDSKQVQDLEMVIAVLMFIRYESLVSSTQFVETSKRHMKGAIALVRARGEAWFQDRDSLVVFRGVRLQMLMDALQNRQPLEDFPGPRGWLGDYLESDMSPEALLIAYEVEMIDMLHRARPLLMSGDSSQETAATISLLLGEAMFMQQRLDYWEMNLPSDWHPKSLAAAIDLLPEDGLESLEVWPGPIHAYSSPEISSNRNHARALQILCGDIANGARAWLDPKSCSEDAAYQLTKNKVQANVDGICHSVPFHRWGHDLMECLQPATENKIAGAVIGSLMLVWPLSAAYGAHGISGVQRHWLRGRLLAMSRSYGLDHATAIVQRCDNLRIFVEPST